MKTIESRHTKAYTFASPANQRLNQSLQKSMLFPTRIKNKKSSLSLKNKTLQTHSPTDKSNLTNDSYNET